MKKLTTKTVSQQRIKPGTIIINLVDLVYKPVNKEVFLAKINNYLELHKYREIVKARYDESEKLIKAVHEGVLGVNEKGIILFANASSARMLGTTTVGLMGVYLESLLEEPHHKAVSEWKERMVNDFERSVFPKHPVIERIKDTLYEGGALYAAMSGSGSSVFGLFEKPTHFKEQSLFSDCFLWEGQLS